MDNERLQSIFRALPEATDAQRYQGLYVVDFGDTTSIGYTAAEVAKLYECDKFGHIQALKICRAMPDGTMELAGVPKERFAAEEGKFFFRWEKDRATEDFETLKRMAAAAYAPYRAKLQLAALANAAEPFVTALIYPAELGEQVNRWLQEAEFRGGEPVEGSISSVAEYYEAGKQVLDQTEIHAGQDQTNRSLSELLAMRHLAVQR